MEEGTAGSTLKRAAISGTLLDWVEDSPDNQAGHEIQMIYYFQDLSDAAAVDLFLHNFEAVSDMAQLIIDGDAGTLGSLQDAGYTLGNASFSQTKWNAFALAVQSASADY